MTRKITIPLTKRKKKKKERSRPNDFGQSEMDSSLYIIEHKVLESNPNQVVYQIHRYIQVWEVRNRDKD